MSEKTSKPESSIRKVAKKVVPLLGAAAVGILPAACSNETPTSPSTSMTTEAKPTSTPNPNMLDEKAKQSTVELETKKAVGAYLNSEERNKNLGQFIDLAGKEIINQYVTGKDVFDGYYPASAKYKDSGWLSQNDARDGWVVLQHNPQYGGSSDTQIIATVATRKDGSFDLSKGVLDVSVRKIYGENKSAALVHLAKPGAYEIASGKPVNKFDKHVSVLCEDMKTARQSGMGGIVTPGEEHSWINGKTMQTPKDVAGFEKLDQDAVDAVAQFLHIDPVNIAK